MWQSDHILPQSTIGHFVHHASSWDKSTTIKRTHFTPLISDKYVLPLKYIRNISSPQKDYLTPSNCSDKECFTTIGSRDLKAVTSI